MNNLMLSLVQFANTILRLSKYNYQNATSTVTLDCNHRIHLDFLFHSEIIFLLTIHPIKSNFQCSKLSTTYQFTALLLCYLSVLLFTVLLSCLQEFCSAQLNDRVCRFLSSLNSESKFIFKGIFSSTVVKVTQISPKCLSSSFFLLFFLFSSFQFRVSKVYA